MKKRMSMKAITVGLFALVLAGLAGPVQAAFEDVEVSPRARAMGMASVGLFPDAYSPFHNPAALSWVTQVEGAASYVQPFGYDFSSQSVISGVGDIGKWGGVGVGVRRFGVDYRGEDLTGETTVSLAHGFRVLQDIQSTVAVGWALNVYSLDYGTSVSGIDPGSATTVGLDISGQVVLHERTRVGFYALNVNNPDIGNVDKEQLIRRVGAGISYAPYRGVVTLLDISNELGEQVQFRGGTEFEVTDFLWLRGGLRTQPNIFTAGFGIRQYGVSVDYGFSTGGGTLDPTHQFGISYILPSGN
jgi:hypothetical protein